MHAIVNNSLGLDMELSEKDKRSQRTRTGKEKTLGPGAGAYIRTLRELWSKNNPDRYTYRAIESRLAESLGLETAIGHMTIRGIEKGDRMPGVNIAAALLEDLRGDIKEFLQLHTSGASEETGAQLAERRFALNAMQDIGWKKETVNHLSDQQFQDLYLLFTKPALLRIMDQIKDNPELQRFIQTVIDNYPKR